MNKDTASNNMPSHQSLAEMQTSLSCLQDNTQETAMMEAAEAKYVASNKLDPDKTAYANNQIAAFEQGEEEDAEIKELKKKISELVSYPKYYWDYWLTTTTGVSSHSGDSSPESSPTNSAHQKRQSTA
jgi:hypothetical protein